MLTQSHRVYPMKLALVPARFLRAPGKVLGMLLVEVSYWPSGNYFQIRFCEMLFESPSNPDHSLQSAEVH